MNLLIFTHLDFTHNSCPKRQGKGLSFKIWCIQEMLTQRQHSDQRYQMRRERKSEYVQKYFTWSLFVYLYGWSLIYWCGLGTKEVQPKPCQWKTVQNFWIKIKIHLYNHLNQKSSQNSLYFFLTCRNWVFLQFSSFILKIMLFKYFQSSDLSFSFKFWNILIIKSA